MPQVVWKSEYGKGGRISLDGVDLTTITAHGVYVIYSVGNPGRVIYVGKGDVAARLGQHRNDARMITAKDAHGPLYVKFAAVSAQDQAGVERYVAALFPPLVGERHPDCTPIAVNSPF